MKIKNFNLPHFDRAFLGDEDHSQKPNKELLEKAINLPRAQLNKEDLEVADVILESLKKDGRLPFDLSPQEKNFLIHNDISKWGEYLIFRYKFIVYPRLKKVADFPAYLLIEPVSSCNYRCIMCFQIDKTFTRKPFMGAMKLDLFKKIIDEAQAGGTKAITMASRGEPTLNKNFCEMLEYTKGKFFEVKVNTNGSKLTEEKCHAILSSGVNELTFSIDAQKKDLYEKIRVNGNFENVTENIVMFNNIRESHYPNSQTMTTASGVFFHEEQNLDDFSKFFAEIVDNVAAVNIENRWNTYENTPHPELQSPCEYLWQRMYIWFDGISNPCDVDYKSQLKIGNVNDSSIRELWHSPMYEKMRESHLNNKREKWNPCDRCGL